MKKEPKYASEAALCADFIAWVTASAGEYQGGAQTPKWTPYAETAGWDILLVGADGTQIGVQAKMKFNMKVLHQCLPGRWASWHEVGPDYRAVLIPEFDGGAEDICGALGLMLFAPGRYGWGCGRDFTPGLNMEHSVGWHYWSPHKRCDVPEFIPDVVAGASGPVQLTKWKIAALRVVARLELQGRISRKDFRDLGVDPRRWTGPSGWLLPADCPGEYIRGTALDFDQQHPTVYVQVLEQERAKLAQAVHA
jgi:hypothetical protein